MHPLMAFYIFSATMTQLAMSSFTDPRALAGAAPAERDSDIDPMSFGMSRTSDHPAPASPVGPLAPSAIRATGEHWCSGILADRLPDPILDRLSTIYWREVAPETVL